MSSNERYWLAELRRKALHLSSNGKLKKGDLDYSIRGGEKAADNVDYLRDEVARLRYALEAIQNCKEHDNPYQIADQALALIKE